MDIYNLITSNFPVQYVYSYPTTRSYLPRQDFNLSQAILTDDINVYIHIPFCNQKCSFCGYLTVIERNENERELYVDALVKEIRNSKSYAHDKTIRTVNFGGGTPSLLSNKQIDKIMEALSSTFPNYQETCNEISMEATPESISYPLLRHLRQHGFNRVSIGIQTLDDHEIATVKRHNLSVDSLHAIELVRKAGIPNLCIDLMYGLPNQTKESWFLTLSSILDYKPETIELYRTVVIPKTGLSKHEDPSLKVGWLKRYESYTYASRVLSSNGYVQDSHVRSIVPNNGFYHQQSNVFKGQSLVGFGVGARSYADNAHYRNIYSTNQSKTAVRKYIEHCNLGLSPVESAVVLTREELARRHIIYNLENLDCAYIQTTYGFNILSDYQNQITTLCDLGIYAKAGNVLKLTNKGTYHRDLIAYMFFSKKSIELEKEYYGLFLRDW